MALKKNLLAFLCAAALLLTLSPPPVRASDDFIFIALNEQIPKLTSNTMPISYGGTFYVPYLIFDMNYMSASFGIGVDLGIRVAAGKNTVMLYNKRRQLIYDLEAGICTDNQGNSYRSALIRGGITYLPIAAVQDFFSEGGLSYVQLNTSYGMLLRLTTPSVVLDNEGFIDAAEAGGAGVLPQMIREYNRGLTPSPSPQPSPSPSPSPSPQPGQDPDRSSVRINFSFLVSDGTDTSALLDLLDQERLSALFFFRPEHLTEHEALIRRMVGSGHAIGLSLPGGRAEEAKAALREGNRLLALIARVNTRTVVLEHGDGTAAVLAEDGWSVWESNVPLPTGGSPSAYTSTLMRAIDGKRAVARLQLPDGSLTLSSLPLLLDSLREDKYSIRLAVGSELD